MSDVILKYVFMPIFVILCLYNVLFCMKVYFHVSGLDDVENNCNLKQSQTWDSIEACLTCALCLPAR